MEHLYQYKAVILKVIDGDTYDAMVDLGFNVFVKKRVRLYGIDTPERNVPEGVKATERVRELIEHQNVILVAVTHEDKYGRFLAKVRLDEQIATHERSADLSEILLEEGYGKEYYGGSK